MLLKSSLNEPNNRPQTSKGQRVKQYYKEKAEDSSRRRNSLENEDSKVNMRRIAKKDKKKIKNLRISLSIKKGSNSRIFITINMG